MQVLTGVDDRTEQIFKLLVESYITNGRPVASKALAGQPSVAVSAATVRNIMARLETRGLVKSPHTSAGKVPTSRGLRFFVDSMLAVEALDEAEQRSLENGVNPDLPPSEMIEAVSQMLSRITELTCVVTLPRRDQSALRHVEFLNLERRPLAGRFWCSTIGRCRTASSTRTASTRRRIWCGRPLHQPGIRRAVLGGGAQRPHRLHAAGQGPHGQPAAGGAGHGVQGVRRGAGPRQGVRRGRGVQPARHQRGHGRRCVACSRRFPEKAPSCTCWTAA